MRITRSRKFIIYNTSNLFNRGIIKEMLNNLTEKLNTQDYEKFEQLNLDFTM